MSHAAHLHRLREEQRRELALMRSRITTLADTLEDGAAPAHWIRMHPYAATAGAAALGFIAAQLPGKSSRPPPPPPPAAPPAAAPAAPPAAAVSSAAHADLLALLAGLAGRFFQAASEAPSPPPASLTIADAGAVADATFRHSFPAPAEDPCPAKPGK